MENQFSNYDCLRYELFEMLLPKMLYTGTEEQKDDFFNLLRQEGKSLIYNMYYTLCEGDKILCPYEEKDFEVEIFERGGVNLLEILLPQYNPGINDILRTYVLFAKCVEEKQIRKYFIIKRFMNGNVFNLHVTPKMEKILGDELTGHEGDMEYEYWRLVNYFSWIVVQDIKK